MKILNISLNALCMSALIACSSPKSETLIQQPISTSNVAFDMDAPLIKYDGLGNPLLPRTSFSEEDIKSNKFVLYKSCYRNPSLLMGLNNKAVLECVAKIERCLKAGSTNCEGKAAFGYNDKVETLVGSNNIEKNIYTMDSQDLTSAALEDTPWSDDYWGIYKGILGHRYADDGVPYSQDWKVNRDYALSTNPAYKFLEDNGVDGIEDLSPSEKYDLLVGNDSTSPSSLTYSMWQQGEYYYNAHGKVETWMGICHGWAPAAYEVERPENEITVTAADGKTKIKFYPQDIKALASYLWSNAKSPSRFIGGRCNTQNPAKDANGRITDDDCFDTNPGTWHMSIVNMIGVKKESFVMDATFDYEVWNQPVYSYSYTYSNPITGKETTNLKEAIVPISKYKNDNFSSYRSPEAAYIVNISMETRYVVENRPSHYAQADNLSTVYYNYDLELDSQYNIIGGEWHTNQHPDFLWTPYNKTAKVYQDSLVTSKWSKHLALPHDWKTAAQSATPSGYVLGSIVEELVKRSRE